MGVLLLFFEVSASMSLLLLFYIGKNLWVYFLCLLYFYASGLPFIGFVFGPLPTAISCRARYGVPTTDPT